MKLLHPLSARHALVDAALALLAACAAITQFLPPLVEATLDSAPRALAAGLMVALALPLHCWFVGLAARRLGGRAIGWVGLAALLFPVGGAAALLLLAGQLRVQPPHAAAAAR